MVAIAPELFRIYREARTLDPESPALVGLYRQSVAVLKGCSLDIYGAPLLDFDACSDVRGRERLCLLYVVNGYDSLRATICPSFTSPGYFVRNISGAPSRSLAAQYEHTLQTLIEQEARL